MGLFGVFGLILAVLFGWYAYALAGRVGRFYKSKFFPEKQLGKKAVAWGKLARGVFALLSGSCFINVRATIAICALHLFLINALLDGVFLLIKLCVRRKEKPLSVCKAVQGTRALPVLLSAVVLIYGGWNMSRVVQTGYAVETDKQIREDGYKIAFLSDVHFDTVHPREKLRETVDRINAQSPDLVILGGDIVEEGTSKEGMLAAFEILGDLESAYGVYFVYGNHDKQSYLENREYTEAELAAAIEGNGIVILEDEQAEINGELVLYGRKDGGHGAEKRQSADELLAGADESKFIVVADHQPLEPEAVFEHGGDLLLSGHTHAGQIFPLGTIMSWSGLLYGEYAYDGGKAIVSSGVAGWGYKIRTQGKCEYLIVRVTIAE